MSLDPFGTICTYNRNILSVFRIGPKLSTRTTEQSDVNFIQFNPLIFYRPQRSCGKVIFSQACVKNSVHSGGGGSTSVHAGIHPRGQTPPWADTPQADTPLDRHPPGRHPPGQTTPQQTATVVDGTQLTGMHNCLLIIFSTVVKELCILRKALSLNYSVMDTKQLL